MLWRTAVITQVRAFLRHGQFEHAGGEDAENPDMPQ
jgi:hypothetical protein